eukprot:UN03117
MVVDNLLFMINCQCLISFDDFFFISCVSIYIFLFTSFKFFLSSFSSSCFRLCDSIVILIVCILFLFFFYAYYTVSIFFNLLSSPKYFFCFCIFAVLKCNCDLSNDHFR